MALAREWLDATNTGVDVYGFLTITTTQTLEEL